ncbi:hypothetical protein C8Q77DRAFT_720450 [Trametes polyzona]|nr:hypothetical protein C8Q77DRAFT_720450 [Trametes polyzona]
MTSSPTRRSLRPCNASHRQSMSSVFPQELYDSVIDATRRDISTLKQCALTCRAWLPRSRYNLYFAPVIGSYSQLHKFSEALDATSENANLVRELVVSIPREVPASLADATLGPLADRVPRLYKLSIVQPPFEYPDRRKAIVVSPQTADWIVHMGTLTHVVLFDLLFSSFADFANIVDSLHHLTSLECISLQTDEQDAIVAGHRMSHVGSLDLQSLMVTGSWQEIPGITKLFKAANPRTLKHLTIDPCVAFNDDYNDFIETLPTYEALETLSFGNLFFPHGDSSMDLVDTIETALAAVPTSRLRRIRIDFTRAMNRSRFDIVETAEIMASALNASLIARPALAGLPVEVCVADYAESTSWWKSELRAALPALHERGAARLVVCDTWGQRESLLSLIRDLLRRERSS